MSQSLSAVYLHIIFSTKGRRAWLLDTSLRARLHEYIGGAARQIDCQPLAIGGVENHVHILCMLGRQTTQANLVKELKRTSTLWLKETFKETQEFNWQAGYAAFSVSQSRLQDARRYVENQEDHHRKVSYQDEVRDLLGKHNLDWDEKYLWD